MNFTRGRKTDNNNNNDYEKDIEKSIREGMNNLRSINFRKR